MPFHKQEKIKQNDKTGTIPSRYIEPGCSFTLPLLLCFTGDDCVENPLGGSGRNAPSRTGEMGLDWDRISGA